ncbi:hypothetical protein J3459_002408 [Metarhizium acridum]|nr:hypothetical protein J3459_002408 [Metarhizium acridum]
MPEYILTPLRWAAPAGVRAVAMLALYSQVFPPPLQSSAAYDGKGGQDPRRALPMDQASRGGPGDAVDQGRLLVWHRVLHTIGFPRRWPVVTGHNTAQQKSKEAGMAPGELPLDWHASQDVSIRRRLGNGGSMSAPRRQW